MPTPQATSSTRHERKSSNICMEKLRRISGGIWWASSAKLPEETFQSTENKTNLHESEKPTSYDDHLSPSDFSGSTLLSGNSLPLTKTTTQTYHHNHTSHRARSSHRAETHSCPCHCCKDPNLDFPPSTTKSSSSSTSSSAPRSRHCTPIRFGSFSSLSLKKTWSSLKCHSKSGSSRPSKSPASTKRFPPGGATWYDDSPDSDDDIPDHPRPHSTRSTRPPGTTISGHAKANQRSIFWKPIKPNAIVVDKGSTSHPHLFRSISSLLQVPRLYFQPPPSQPLHYHPKHHLHRSPYPHDQPGQNQEQDQNPPPEPACLHSPSSPLQHQPPPPEPPAPTTEQINAFHRSQRWQDIRLRDVESTTTDLMRRVADQSSTSRHQHAQLTDLQRLCDLQFEALANLRGQVEGCVLAQRKVEVDLETLVYERRMTTTTTTTTLASRDDTEDGKGVIGS